MSEKKEYIERGALSERAEIIRKKMLTEKHEPFTIDIMNDFADLLDQYAKDIPAADVETVVRGEWEEHPIADTTDEGEQYVAMFWQCSNCHGKLIYWNFQRTKYCPDCGAHMMERIGSGE